MEPVGSQTAILSYGSYTGIPGTDYYTKFTSALDCCRDAMDHGCINQCINGAFQSFCWRYASFRSAYNRFRNSEFLHRYRSSYCVCASLCSYKLVSHSEYCTGRTNPSVCKALVLYRWCGIYSSSDLDNYQNKGIFAGRARRIFLSG